MIEAGTGNDQDYSNSPVNARPSAASRSSCAMATNVGVAQPQVAVVWPRDGSGRLMCEAQMRPALRIAPSRFVVVTDGGKPWMERIFQNREVYQTPAHADHSASYGDPWSLLISPWNPSGAFNLRLWTAPHKTELESLDIFNQLFKQVLEGKLHTDTARFEGNSRVLDLGCGSGLWVVSMAQELDSTLSSIVGVYNHIMPEKVCEILFHPLRENSHVRTPRCPLNLAVVLPINDWQSNDSDKTIGRWFNIALTNIILPMSFSPLCKASDLSRPTVGTVKDHLQWDAFDLIDGLLFYSILDETSEVLLGHTTPASATRLSQKLKALSGVDCSSALEGLLHQLSSRRSEVSHKQFNVPMQPVLDFTHPALDKYFEDVKITSHTAAKQQNSEIFREATHWHNSKNTLSEIHCKALDESTK
uniref:Methyltransferase domain-containing protein n=1 Tax=Pyricularia oryzae (strain P131) TaxID=1143193 RepID=L7JAL7_PYRO1